jgi:dihydrofolate synthase/folylpolyglutamate synthase
MEKPQATYPATLDFLYNHLPMFSRIGIGAFKKDLTNITVLCKALDDPQNKFKSIHVAGTNGKGSVSHSLAAVLQQSGYKAGLYTSPHLKDFRERIRINGEVITEEFVIEFVQTHFNLVRRVQPSFFEITVAMAFEWFAKNTIDIAVVEVGLGGRLDSTNIIRPELSVITNISYDHQQLLGNTLQEIAGEKAGIIKPGIPVVIGETQGETLPVFLEKAKAGHSSIIFADQEWEIKKEAEKDDRLILVVKHKKDDAGRLFTYELDLSGPYQGRNLLTTLTAIQILREQHWKITDENMVKALSSVKELTGLRGRWEILGHHPLIIADVAHNVGGITEIMRRIKTLSCKQLHIVTGFVKDKPLDLVLPLFPKDAKYYFCQAPIPRALPSDRLAEIAGGYDLHGKHYSDVTDAFQAAKSNAGNDDLILICGSVFVVAEVLETGFGL